MTIDPVVIDKRPRSLAAHVPRAGRGHARRGRATTTRSRAAGRSRAGGRPTSWSRGWPPGCSRSTSSPRTASRSIASTRYEWVLAYLATLWAGAAVTAVDPAADDDTIAQRADRLRARAWSSPRTTTPSSTLWRIRARIRDVTKVVQIDGDFPDDRVLTLEGLLGLGHEHLSAQPRALSQRLYAVRRQGLAALPYADDQRGGLRGVRLTHAALTYQATAVSMLGELTEADLVYVALPLRRRTPRRCWGSSWRAGSRSRWRDEPTARRLARRSCARPCRGRDAGDARPGARRRSRSATARRSSGASAGSRRRCATTWTRCSATGCGSWCARARTRRRPGRLLRADAGVTVLEAYGRARDRRRGLRAPGRRTRAAGRPAAPCRAPRCASPTTARSRSPGPG